MIDLGSHPLNCPLSLDLGHLHSEDEPRLQLEHPRRVDVCERRDCVRCGADTPNELSKGGRRGCGIAIDCDSAAEEVSVIEQIEALESEQDRRAF